MLLVIGITAFSSSVVVYVYMPLFYMHLNNILGQFAYTCICDGRLSKLWSFHHY